MVNFKYEHNDITSTDELARGASAAGLGTQAARLATLRHRHSPGSQRGSSEPMDETGPRGRSRGAASQVRFRSQATPEHRAAYADPDAPGQGCRVLRLSWQPLDNQAGSHRHRT